MCRWERINVGFQFVESPRQFPSKYLFDILCTSAFLKELGDFGLVSR